MDERSLDDLFMARSGSLDGSAWLDVVGRLTVARLTA
jgi:hypothetical protein